MFNDDITIILSFFPFKLETSNSTEYLLQRSFVVVAQPGHQVQVCINMCACNVVNWHFKCCRASHYTVQDCFC